MKNRPHGNELLQIARRTLLDELLPLVPEDKKYDALMVANAMAIAARELERTDAQDPAIDQLIKDFYQRMDREDAQRASEMSLSDLLRKRAVPPQHGRDVHALLLSITRSKLAVSNPKYARVDHHGE